MASSRRDWLLQQLGITQWTLRRPAVLQGEVAISLPDQVRLVIIANAPPADDDPLLGDVLRSLALTPRQVYSLTPQQAVMLPENTRCHCWLMGVDDPIRLNGGRLTSPALAELYNNAGARRALWQQICEHENDFYPDARRPAPGAAY
ncbi:DNA polymerase III subunit psi [Affinibrenneria salicis]|uniref:DNA polymerase III subunit psi n=1 Tax=Affinibrenneria salicis TaxID=2590031 RepID=A0A5J5G697_9GAMM|nr:DNA polymerase III subunit psi [Affinibrenneria salicis]KAA9002709.1 DNA polymerase III subunit psi [Affinibrenneria salicis]KAA9003004.1 DNA polymerase III subunit psi [Affinibrenneria salicis]